MVTNYSSDLRSPGSDFGWEYSSPTFEPNFADYKTYLWVFFQKLEAQR